MASILGSNADDDYLVNNAALDKNRERKIRLTQIAGKFGTTLALKPVYAHLVDDAPYGDTPAWSDSENIYFSAPKLGDVTNEDVVISVKGLTLHEISHIMWTPRSGSNLAKHVQKERIFPAFNALEDQRIEMAMVAKFPMTKDWLTAMIAQHLLASPDQVKMSMPLLHGRKYLPAAIRQAVNDAYVKQDNVVKIASLIDEYVSMNLADTRNFKRAGEIIKEYYDLVFEGTSNGQDPTDYANGWTQTHDPNGHKYRGSDKLEYKSSPNKPMGTDEQAKVMKKVKQQVESDDQPADNDAQQNDSSNASSGNGTAFGGKSGLLDALDDVIANVKKTYAKDIAKTIAQYNGDISLNGKALPPLPKADWHQDSPTATSVNAVKSFARELELIKAQFDPGWTRKVDQGKLNVQQYITGADLEECFDEWDMGREDATDIECVVVLDTSSSMGGQARGAFESMWATKRALDKIGASTTVLTFDAKCHTLYSADEKAAARMRTIYLGGSTEPLPALQQAKSILANSNRAVKILFTITDGSWWESHKADNLIKELRNAGVITTLAWVYQEYTWLDDNSSRAPKQIDTHGCEVAMAVSDTSQLYHIARAMVDAGIKRNLSA
jgi:hypothetical protein